MFTKVLTPYASNASSSGGSSPDALAELKESFLAQLAQQAIGRFSTDNGIIDGYVDSSGIDAGSSSNYSQSSGVVSNTTSGGTYNELSLTSSMLSTTDAYQAGYSPDNTIDGNTGTVVSFTSDAGSIIIDYGEAVRTGKFGIVTGVQSYPATGCTLSGSSDGESWSTLSTQSGLAASTTEVTFEYTPATHQYYKLELARPASSYVQAGEIALYSISDVTQNEMTVVSTTQGLTSTPTNGYIYTLIKDTGAGDALVATSSTETSNNIRMYVTADDGTTWTWLQLTSLGLISDGLYAYESALSALSSPSTTLGYKYSTHNIGTEAPGVQVGGINVLVD